MNKQLNAEEQLIVYFLDKYNQSQNNNITISQKDLPNINLSEQEIIKTIYIMEENGLLDIKNNSVHKNFNTFWTLTLKDPCINYFKYQKQFKKEKRIKFLVELRAWITLAIAVLSFILSVYSIYLKEIQIK